MTLVATAICVATVALETGIVPMKEPSCEVAIEFPGGIVSVTATCANGRVTGVTLTNVPSCEFHYHASESMHLENAMGCLVLGCLVLCRLNASCADSMLAVTTQCCSVSDALLLPALYFPHHFGAEYASSSDRINLV